VKAEKRKDLSVVVQFLATGVAGKGGSLKNLSEQPPASTSIGLAAAGTTWMRSSEKHVGPKMSVKF
jgi:hypothetical protein